MDHTWLNSTEPTIVYIGDPMCSWCYGMAPTLTEIQQRLPDHSFEIVLGGLRPGGTEFLHEMGDFLDHHWKEVEKRTGQPFTYDILKKEGIVVDTGPSCRAVVVARNMDKLKSFAFFKAVQHAFYVKNKDMSDLETYLEIAGELGLDSGDFAERFEAEDTRYETRSDFQLAAEMGISGFPSIILRHKDQLYLAANGYRSAEDLLAVIERIRQE